MSPLDVLMGLLLVGATLIFFIKGFIPRPKDPRDGPKWWWFIDWFD